MKIKIIFLNVISVVALFALIGIDLSYALDNLILNGVVKSVNHKKQEITIDVKSGSCPGMRTFHIDSAQQGLKKDMIGKRIIFSIDSSVCNDQKEHTIKIIPPKGGLR